MPQSCRIHRNGGATDTDPSNVTYRLAVGATTMIIPVYTGMGLQTLICPSNLTATEVTMVEMSFDYSPGSLNPVSPTGGTWYQLYNSGNPNGTAVAATAFGFYVAASRAVRLNPPDFYGCNWIRLTFNTAQLTTAALFIGIDGILTGV
jgi:hypothetical protein